MKLGAMNHNKKDAVSEIRAIGEMGFSFLDLTIENPEATPEKLLARKQEILDVIASYRLEVVGHLPWHFHFTYPYESIRRAYIKEATIAMDAARAFGADRVSIHNDMLNTIHANREAYVRATIDSTRELNDSARERGLVLCFENYTHDAFTFSEFDRLFAELPEVKFHLDIGHANLNEKKGEGTLAAIERFKGRLAHVHAHDNLGEKDEHLALGEGTVNWERVVRALKSVYDGTVTLEVHGGKPWKLAESKLAFEKLLAQE